MGTAIMAFIVKFANQILGDVVLLFRWRQPGKHLLLFQGPSRPGGFIAVLR